MVHPDDSPQPDEPTAADRFFTDPANDWMFGEVYQSYVDAEGNFYSRHSAGEEWKLECERGFRDHLSNWNQEDSEQRRKAIREEGARRREELDLWKKANREELDNRIKASREELDNRIKASREERERQRVERERQREERERQREERERQRVERERERNRQMEARRADFQLRLEETRRARREPKNSS
ncbi:hypothetical protein PtA15_8A180 [Puccinia triticina]|uniref:WW domain-containing protein n=1 Tax=Puccinia triticina TaxID=208348 RepID=A0ABY7CPV1_9BASI|nr:uncharacterized protein PtA15_8A180 [Puccinia triticina]WAQ87276.1 hypothetical protein PtA15_8A180 [Puccinia triticina]